MLLELELPRVLAPDLSSNCYSGGDLSPPHVGYRGKPRHPYVPSRPQGGTSPGGRGGRLGALEPLDFPPTPRAQSPSGERCAPAALLRGGSCLSGYLSRIEP